MHLPTERGGILYTGDFSVESPLLPCDPFPRAGTVVADASCGDRDASLPDQVKAIAPAARGGAILPCPAHGRGPDMVAALRACGLPVIPCGVIAAEIARLTGQRPPAVTAPRADPRDIIVAAGPNAETGLPGALRRDPRFRFVFSSHVPRTSPARTMIEEGRAQWLGWNVHPRLADLRALTTSTGARRILPAFVDLATAPLLVAALGRRLCRDTATEV